MANLRVISDNAVDRATLSASTTAGTLVVNNLLTDTKSDIYRSATSGAGVSANTTITATWAVAELIGGVAIPYCNLTTSATMRVRVYTLSGDATPAFDSGTVACCPATALSLWNFTSVLASNSYGYGGGTCARVWLTTPTAGQKIVVDIIDSGNVAGYIEAARLVAGKYFEPAYNPDFGASIATVDSSKQYRNDAGDLMTDYGTRHRKQTLALSQMSPADRQAVWNIFYANGLVRPLFVSLYPNSTDNQLEQQYQMYCKLVTNPSMSTPYYNRYNTSFDLEEV